jgi:hypothetical protein
MTVETLRNAENCDISTLSPRCVLGKRRGMQVRTVYAPVLSSDPSSCVTANAICQTESNYIRRERKKTHLVLGLWVVRDKYGKK